MSLNYRFSFFDSSDESIPEDTLLIENHNITFSLSRGINFQYGPNQKVINNLLVLTSTNANDDLKINSIYQAILTQAIGSNTVYMIFEQLDENNEVSFTSSKILLTDVRAMFSDVIGEGINTTRSFVSNLHIGFNEV